MTTKKPKIKRKAARRPEEKATAKRPENPKRRKASPFVARESVRKKAREEARKEVLAPGRLIDALLYGRKISVDQASLLRESLLVTKVGTALMVASRVLESDTSVLDTLMQVTQSLFEARVKPLPSASPYKPFGRKDGDDDGRCGESSCASCGGASCEGGAFKGVRVAFFDGGEDEEVHDADRTAFLLDGLLGPKGYALYEVCHVDDTDFSGPPLEVWIHASAWMGEEVDADGDPAFTDAHVLRLMRYGALIASSLTAKQRVFVFVPQPVGLDVKVEVTDCGGFLFSRATDSTFMQIYRDALQAQAGGPKAKPEPEPAEPEPEPVPVGLKPNEPEAGDVASENDAEFEDA